MIQFRYFHIQKDKFCNYGQSRISSSLILTENFGCDHDIHIEHDRQYKHQSCICNNLTTNTRKIFYKFLCTDVIICTSAISSIYDSYVNCKQQYSSYNKPTSRTPHSCSYVCQSSSDEYFQYMSHDSIEIYESIGMSGFTCSINHCTDTPMMMSVILYIISA